jgi:hypothetical protein
MDLEERKSKIMNNNISAKTSNGLTVGTCMGISIASVLSWTTWHNIWWCILHSGLGWCYVIYYIIKYIY